MLKAILRFKSLADLAIYVKRLQPEMYLINTLTLTLRARLSARDISLAVKEYQATVLYPTSS